MENPFLPNPASIENIKDLASNGDTKLFRIKFKDENVQKKFTFKPGQFVEISVLGIGEAPISICSNPQIKNYFELCIKNVGSVTSALHNMKIGDSIHIRGPYGNGFPFNEVKGKEILFVAGGIGLAPLRGLITQMLANNNDFKKILVLYGARTPGDIIFKEELVEWGKNVEVRTTVDKGDEKWDGNVGVVGALLPKTKVSVESVAFVCGPPIMLKFVIKDLIKLGFNYNNIITTLERKMQCGIGKCGHCNIGSKYVCIDGPVFTFEELEKIPDALEMR